MDRVRPVLEGSVTIIDAAALAQARERLEKQVATDLGAARALRRIGTAEAYIGASSCEHSAADLRLVLDALRDARRQAFEEAKQKVKELISSGWSAAEPSARNEALDFAAFHIGELAAKEQS